MGCPFEPITRSPTRKLPIGRKPDGVNTGVDVGWARPRMKASGRHLDHATLEILADLLGLEHVVQRVKQRPQVRVHLGHQVAGQEAEPLSRLDRGAREDDPVDLATAERGRGERDRKEGLAGTCRADPERDRVVADRVDVALLVDGLGRDLGVAVAPDDVLEDRRRGLVLVQRVGDRLDRPGRDLVSLGDQFRELAHDGRAGVDSGGVALEREHVAAQEHITVQVPLQRAQHRVLAARQLGGDCVVELELPAQWARPMPLALERRRACRRRGPPTWP